MLLVLAVIVVLGALVAPVACRKQNRRQGPSIYDRCMRKRSNPVVCWHAADASERWGSARY